MPGLGAHLADPGEHADRLVGRGGGGLGPPGRAAVLLDQQHVGEGAADVDTEPVTHRPPVPSAWARGPHHHGAGVVDVRGHHGPRPGRVAGPDRGDDLDVVGQAAAQRGVVVGVEVAQHDRCVHGPGQRARPVAGWSASATSRPWNSRLSGNSASRSWSGPGAPTAQHGAGQLVERRRRPRRAGPRHGERGELRLQRGPQVEDALQLGDGPAAHPGAAVGHDLDEALGGQPGQRLPHRRPADAEPLGQLDLAEPGAGGEVAAQDQLAHLRRAPARTTSRSAPAHLPSADCVQRRPDGLPRTSFGG